ncbi:unnamed protein product [Caretta caretta]
MIHPDQTYTVPGCTIFDNLYLVRDLLELGCRDDLSFTLLSLDQKKAFDRVDHGYLLSTLRLRGLALREPELRLVLLAYVNNVLLVVQDPGNLAQVEACQAVYSAASSAWVNWVKSSGLVVGDWWFRKKNDHLGSNTSMDIMFVCIKNSEENLTVQEMIMPATSKAGRGSTDNLNEPPIPICHEYDDESVSSAFLASIQEEVPSKYSSQDKPGQDPVMWPCSQELSDSIRYLVGKGSIQVTYEFFNFPQQNRRRLIDKHYEIILANGEAVTAFKNSVSAGKSWNLT